MLNDTFSKMQSFNFVENIDHRDHNIKNHFEKSDFTFAF
jgi:hypothetical protein